MIDGDFIPGQRVMVRRVVPSATGLMPYSVVTGVDKWFPATFLGFDRGYPCIEWPDGTRLKLASRKDMR